MTIHASNKLLTYYLALFAFFYIVTIVLGIYNYYSPVPFMDMWNGYVEFYTKVVEGDWKVWFSQHNEHRIVLSRILFWIDFYLFDGKIYSLLIGNFLLMAAIAITFYQFISHLFDQSRVLKVSLTLVVIILTFSWIQAENIVIGFQSQFFLAYLVPLLSFYMLAQYSDTKKSYHFFISVILGALSVLTMGNGIVALPLLIIFGLVLKLPKQKIVIIIAVTIATLYAYNIDYVAPTSHSSLQDMLIQDPGYFFWYILIYLGGPFTHTSIISFFFKPELFGFVFIASSLFLTYKAFKSNANGYIFALLIFIAYIGATAFGTAGSRVSLGLLQALSGRYMTPALMGWSSLLIIFAYYYAHNPKLKKIFNYLFLFIPLSLLYAQTDALEHQGRTVKMQSALALELSINDERIATAVFPYYGPLLKISSDAKRNDLSIFGNPLIKNASLLMGTKIDAISTENLAGSLDDVQIINEDKRYCRVSGWLFDSDLKEISDQSFVVNSDHIIVGYIIGGYKRDDVASAIDSAAQYSGFVGYLKSDALVDKELFIVDAVTHKTMKIDPQQILKSKEEVMP
jgi:hypothetical protein